MDWKQRMAPDHLYSQSLFRGRLRNFRFRPSRSALNRETRLLEMLFLEVLSNFRRNLAIGHLVDCFDTNDAAA
jgi:hypothetical protein